MVFGVVGPESYAAFNSEGGRLRWSGFGGLKAGWRSDSASSPTLGLMLRANRYALALRTAPPPEKKGRVAKFGF